MRVMKKVRIGKWYCDNCTNHLYLVVATKYASKGLKYIKCAFYRDLQYCGLVQVEASRFRLKPLLSKKSICFLQPVNNIECWEIKNTLNSI